MAPLEDRIRAMLAGRYQVERELGRGGMATVFLAEDVKHGRRVAVKVLSPELSAMLGMERFQREIAFAARLQHPHILPLLDSGSGDGLMYYVMPFVEGESLRARLDRERQLPVEEAARLAEEIARALDHAHRQGIVHRDIKPENILLADGQAMVADFGLARAIRVAGDEHLTQSGMTLGTPPYMSPEQVAGATELDGRTDIYSLGCLLYEMLAGQPPFTGPPEALAHQHLNLEPRPISQLRPASPPALEAVVQKALAKTPADRFATAADMAAALHGPSSQGIPAWTPGATPRTPAAAPAIGTPAPAVPAPARARPRWVVPVGVAAAIAVVALALWRFGPDVLQRLSGAGHAPGTRQWVWLASFDGPADDPGLAPASRDLVAAALDQSKRIATVPDQQVRVALHNAGRPDSTRVDAELARQLAYRSSIPVVVAGRIGRIGSAYTIALRAMRAGNGDPILTVEDQARDESALVPTLAHAARELRKGLGERVGSLQPEQAVGDAPTPSFEAFKLYVRGRQLNKDGDPYSALVFLRRAIALDPDFATAWLALGTVYGNSGAPDSAWWAYHQALRHGDRLTTTRRLDVEAKVAGMRFDVQAQLADYNAILKLDPTPSEAASALNNIGTAMAGLGRYEQALELFRRSAAAWPVEPPVISRQNIVDALIGLGKLGEARARAAELPGYLKPAFLLDVALAERNWSESDSLANVLRLDPDVPASERWYAAVSHASVLGLRGESEAAAGELALAPKSFGAGAGAFVASDGWWAEALFAHVRGVEIPPPPRTSRPIGPALAAVHAAMIGDSTTARRELASWNIPMRPVRDACADMIEGWLDWHLQKWPEVVSRLRESARGGKRDESQAVAAWRGSARWLMADAFEGLGQKDSTLAYLHLVLDTPGDTPQLLMSAGLWEPYARRRVVELDLSLGRIDEARRQWDVLQATCVHPDPPLAAKLQGTRAALLAAEGLRGGSTK